MGQRDGCFLTWEFRQARHCTPTGNHQIRSYRFLDTCTKKIKKKRKIKNSSLFLTMADIHFSLYDFLVSPIPPFSITDLFNFICTWQYYYYYFLFLLRCPPSTLRHIFISFSAYYRSLYFHLHSATFSFLLVSDNYSSLLRVP